MIKSLRLKNIALIKSAEIDFHEGLNVLSGETGAGKTVIISAINFALGAKADKSMIRYGESECEAELIFDIDCNDGVKDVLSSFGIDYDDDLIIRRKLNESGKGDIRVNGVSVTGAMLKQITSELCDVYGQSEHYSLLKQSNQLKVLDSYIGNEIILLKNECKPIIDEIKKCKLELENFGGSNKDRLNKIDLLSYQINEIEKAELIDGEEEELLARKKILNNVEKIGEALSGAKAYLSEDNAGCDCVYNALNKIENVNDLDSEYSSLTDRLYSVKAELDDVASTLENLLDNLEYDGNEAERIENRLDVIKSLKRKYGNSYSEIIEYLSKSQIELENLQNFETRSNELEKIILNNENKLKNLYSKINLLRTEKSKTFSNSICSELKMLGMKNAQFVCSVIKGDENTLSLNGIDSVEFTFSANKGEPLKPMSKIISGGEMSRFMLAMKLVCADFPQRSTYIFDEIDAGISGAVAEIVAEKFAILSKNMQIVTISHLAQIVSFSDCSLLISKTDDDVKTQTNITPLDENGKINEITRIIGGDVLSQASITLAKEMIDRANTVKENLRK